MELKSIQVGPV